MSKKLYPLSAVTAVCLALAGGLVYAQTTDSSNTTPRTQGAAPGTDTTGSPTGTTSGQVNPNSTRTTTAPETNNSATGTTGTGTLNGNTGTGTMQSNTDTNRRSDTMGGTMSDRDARGFNADGMRAARRDRN